MMEKGGTMMEETSFPPIMEERRYNIPPFLHHYRSPFLHHCTWRKGGPSMMEERRYNDGGKEVQ